MDYLMEEVLQRQSAEIQTFLLQTSILEQLSAPLCDAVSVPPPRAGSHSILEHLDQTNLFVTPLDDRRIWYRYHRLFADLLQRQLRQRWPDLVPELHRRASAWYEEQDLVPESIEHALVAGDFERAAMLIERVAEALMMRSELMTLRNWLDALPEPILYQRPQLCAYHAWLLLLGGESVRAVESRITALRDYTNAEPGQIHAVRALIAVSQGRIDGVPALTERALETLTEDDGFWYSVARWLRDLLQVSDDDLHTEDTGPLRRLIHTQLDSRNVLLAVIGVCNLGELRLKQGRLREAEELFSRALSRATDAGGQRLPIAGEPLIWLGELARERNDLPAAEDYLMEGIERIREWGPVAAIDGYTNLARLRYAQRDEIGAAEAIEQANRLAVMFDATEMDDHMVAMCRARIAALQGDFAAVERWAESRGLDGLDPDDLQLDATVELHLRKYELVVLGLARVLEGRPREALPFLKPLLSYVAAKGRWGLSIETLALQAAAHHLLGETARALARLERALARAEPEGYVRLFVEIGEPMALLLYEAAQHDVFPEYAGRLLAAFPEPAEPAAASQQPRALIEPLSQRELEVLAAIAEGLSNQEAAQRLYISERTVKWHASNIYGKLQVSNRTEAVARARSLGILPK
jgi:LuxR family maltose regulon positive regulatory protein